MDDFTLIVCVLGAVLVSSFVSRFIPRISTPLVEILLGVLASQLPFFPAVRLDPELFMVLFIAPLLFEDARNVDKPELLRTLGISLSMAVGLVLATMLVIGFSLHQAWAAVPLAAAIALGAALGPTDAVAVSSIGREANLSTRQSAVLKGESLFNDASGVIGFQFAILAATTGTFSLGEAVGEFLLSFVGGVLLGLLFGLLINSLFAGVRAAGWETTTSRVLLEVFMPFLIYLASGNVAHVSGILAVVTAGLTVRFDRSGISPNTARTNIVAASVWSVLSFSLNGAVFILLGMQLPVAMRSSWSNVSVSNGTLIGIILLVSTVLVVMRFAWVGVTMRLAMSRGAGGLGVMTNEGWRSVAVMTVGGAKGAITLALMFTTPYVLADGSLFPMRDELIFIASGVIIVTLALANFALPLLAPNRTARVPEEAYASTIEVLRRTIVELGSRQTPENRMALQWVIGSYNKRIQRLKQRNEHFDAHAFELLQIHALHWEQDYIEKRLRQAESRIPADGGHTAASDPEARSTALDVEAATRLLQRISDSLRHLEDSETGWAAADLRRRLRSLSHQANSLLLRLENRVRRSTPLIAEDELFAHTRRLQTAAIDSMIRRLYTEMGSSRYRAEDISTLIIDYERARAALSTRPTIGLNAHLLSDMDEIRREAYAIELGVITDMLENDEISRAQARQLRRNIYVMQVDADSSV